MVARQRRSVSRWAWAVGSSVVLVHGALIGASWASSIWSVERLDRSKNAIVDLAFAAPPPPPAAPPAGAPKPVDEPVRPRRPQVTDIVQVSRPDREKRSPVATVTGDSIESTSEISITGVTDAPPVQALPPAPPRVERDRPPKIVPPTALKRVAGEAQIPPDDSTRMALHRDATARVTASFSLCVGDDGRIDSIDARKSSGYAAYDAKLLAALRSWRYQPYTVDGKAVPACTVVTFVYSQR